MPFTALRDFRLYLHTPTAIFKARVNMASITYPVTALTFDDVTLGAFGDIAPDATLILGSADGLDDYGRVRVQNVATSTTIPVGRVSQGTEDGTLNITDNAYITVWNDFRVWAKIPYDAPSGIDYKDSNIEVGTYNTELPPVANCGPGFADYIDGGTSLITVTFDGTASFAMADGATISTYAWDLQGGTVTAGSLASSTLTATFPAGFRWVSLTVTDSNGRPHTARCPVLAVDPASDPTIKFQVEAHRIEMRGQTLGFELFDDLLRTTFPDGGLVMFWADEPIDPTDRSHMAFIGWHQSDSFSIRATPTGNIRTTVLNCVDVAGRLAALPGFPQALQREAELDADNNPIDIMWALMPTLDMRKCLWYLAFWHSTALSLADFLLPANLSDYPAMRLDSTGASLYEQINSRAQSCVPDHWLTCNIQGQLLVKPDWMLLDFADRPVSTAGTFTEDYWQDMRADYMRPPRVYVLNSSAVVCSTDWLTIGGEDTLPLAFCKAPGVAFGQGVSEATTGEKLTISQAQLNACEGHRYARLNARYGLFTIVEPTGDIQEFQPAHMLPVQVNISALTAAQRGLDFTIARGLVKSIDLRYNHTEHGTWVQPTVMWEREVTGLPAVTHIPEEATDPDYEVPEPPPATVPPDLGLIGGQQLVAAIGVDGYRYKTTDFQTVSGSGGPTWTRDNLTIAATIYSFVVDPFSPGYAPGATTGAVNGWVVNDTDIYRVTDMHGTTVATSVFTFPTATVGASFHWRSIQASFGAFFAEGVNPWLMCVSYYGSTGGHTGTWATYSTDGGVTWSAEVQISAHYNTTAPIRFNGIGVYCSPKTPGLAYTVAYSETAADAQAIGYVSVNWGATWAAYTAIDAGSGHAGSVHLPWPDNADEAVFYHGKLITAVEAGTADEFLPFFGLFREYQGAANDEETYTALGLGVSAAGTTTVTGIVGESTQEDAVYVIIAPPPDTVRLKCNVTWSASRNRTSAFTASSTVMSIQDGSGTAHTGSLGFSTPAYGTPNSGGGVIEWTGGAGATDWPVNNETIVSSPPTTTPIGCRIRGYTNASAFGSAVADATIDINVEVLEIELDNGTIYTPVLPTGARSFRLKRIDSGVVQDISPANAGIFYGINDYGFAARSFDNDRLFMAVAGIGNDVSGVVADDLVGLWTSVNAGSSWANILAPVAAAAAPRGLQIAFGGNSSAILFAWGGISNGALPAIWYSSNGGTLLDSREGNINSLGTATLIGLAGGPG